MPPRTPVSAGVDLAAYLVHRENLDGITDQLTRALGVSFEGPHDLNEHGLALTVNWDAQIALVAITDPSLAPVAAAQLEERGEGLLFVAMGVQDLDASVTVAKEMGLAIRAQLDALAIEPAWAERFERMDITFLDPVGTGVPLALSQIRERSDHVSRARSIWIDHGAFMVLPENFESVMARVEQLLGVAFDGPHDLRDRGSRVAVDWDAGLEFVTVADASLAVGQSARLKEKGEGFSYLIMGVEDLDEAVATAHQAGLGTVYAYDGLTITDDWRERFDRIDEVIVEEAGADIRLGLSRITQKPAFRR